MKHLHLHVASYRLAGYVLRAMDGAPALEICIIRYRQVYQRKHPKLPVTGWCPINVYYTMLIPSFLTFSFLSFLPTCFLVSVLYALTYRPNQLSRRRTQINKIFFFIHSFVFLLVSAPAAGTTLNTQFP